jgi:hypothetical protein
MCGLLLDIPLQDRCGITRKEQKYFKDNGAEETFQEVLINVMNLSSIVMESSKLRENIYPSFI